MRERDVPVDDEDPRGLGFVKGRISFLVSEEGLYQGERRTAMRRRQGDDRSRWLRQACLSCPMECGELTRDDDFHRRGQVTGRVQLSATELEREQRIAGGDVMNPSGDDRRNRNL